MSPDSHIPLLLDGAMGTLLESRGVDTSGPAWTAIANRVAGDEVLRAHLEYIRAGCDIVTANTFRCNPSALLLAGLHARSSEALAREAVRLARAAVAESGTNRTIAVAGSIGPVGGSYRSDTPSETSLRREHSEAIATLVDAGVDLILCETISTVKEAALLGELAEEVGVPLWLSLVPSQTGTELLSGAPLTEVANLPLESVDVLLFNCASPAVTVAAVSTLKAEFKQAGVDRAVGAYPNASSPDSRLSYDLMHDVPDEEFVRCAVDLLDTGINVLGGCCGTTPQTIFSLHQILSRRRIRTDIDHG